MMKVQLDADRCSGHGRCYVLAPAVFGSDDDGYGTVLDEAVGADHARDAELGTASCPERAITLSP